VALTTSLGKRGLVKEQNDDIFILNNARVPAIIVETGYITNRNDLNYLLKKENQQKIAQGIYNGIMRAYQEFKPAK
jgi:N-acetylmuramoyl-L-alanine amidase